MRNILIESDVSGSNFAPFIRSVAADKTGQKRCHPVGKKRQKNSKNGKKQGIGKNGAENAGNGWKSHEFAAFVRKL